MICQRCDSDRIYEMVFSSGEGFAAFKGEDLYDGENHYVGVGRALNPKSGIRVCLECGQVQNKFPCNDPE